MKGFLLEVNQLMVGLNKLHWHLWRLCGWFGRRNRFFFGGLFLRVVSDGMADLANYGNPDRDVEQVTFYFLSLHIYTCLNLRYTHKRFLNGIVNWWKLLNTQFENLQINCTEQQLYLGFYVNFSIMQCQFIFVIKSSLYLCAKELKWNHT